MTAPLASLLPWDAMVNDRVLINKDGALMACLRVRGQDLHSALDSALVVQAARLNQVLMRLGAGWSLLSEARRQAVCSYHDTTWPCAAARLVDEERRAAFLRPQTHYATTVTLTVTWAPARTTTAIPRWRQWCYTNLPDMGLATQTARFEDELRRMLGLLQDVYAEVAWLDGMALLTYLHTTVSWQDHPVAIPDPPCYLDTYLTDTDLARVWALPHLGRWPKLGDQWLRCVGVKAYPQATAPGMLDVLDTLPLDYRACVRYVPISRAQAVREARKYGDSHYGKRTRAGGSTGRVEQIAVDYSDEAAAFQAGVEHGQWSAGAVTQTVVVWDADFAQATAKAEQVEHALHDANYVARVEGMNTLAAWVGTLPGETQANVRTPLLTTRNLAHLLPATQAWQGHAWNSYLNGPPLLYTTGRGATPFRLDFHGEDDTGHWLVVGPTGSGKSLLLALLALQWLKYPQARVVIFDKDQSLRCATYAVGGRWYDLAEEVERMSQAGQRLDDLDTKPWGGLWQAEDSPWRCFETAGLLSTPAIIPQVLLPLLRQIEAGLTGVPTMILLDEAWCYLKQDVFAARIQDWLKTLRKKGAVVGFCTQNLTDIAQSALDTDIHQACQTKIFLPDAQALEPKIGALYEGYGLNARQRAIVAGLQRKRQYYFKGRGGHQVFELGVGPVTLAFTGAARKEDLALMADIYKSAPDAFASNWLHARGLHAEAEALANAHSQETLCDEPLP